VILVTDAKRISAADFVTAILFLILGPIINYVSLNMRVYRNFLDAPGFFPMILGIVIVLLGVILMASALKRNGVEELKAVLRNNEIVKGLKSEEMIRALIIVGIMAVYIFGLVGRINFTLATFLYLAVTMMYLKATKVVNIVLISLISAIVISYSFGSLFNIPLP